MSLDSDSDVRPFRLLDLPAELRIRIYEIMVVRGVLIILLLDPNKHSPMAECVLDRVENGESWSDDFPLLNICRANRQVLDEVKPLFYGNTTFRFERQGGGSYDRSEIVTALQFLSDLPDCSLSMIRSLDLDVTSLPDDGGQIAIGPEDLASFKELCKLLSSRCKLRSLHLNTVVWADYLERSDYRTARLLLDTPIPGIPVKVPSWIRELDDIKHLKHLGVKFEFVRSNEFLQQVVATLKHMRSTMAEGGDKMTGKEGIRVSLLHSTCSDEAPGYRYRWRTLICSLEVYRGESDQLQYRRVKVDPSNWCKCCGKFLNRMSCDCDGIGAGSSQHYSDAGVDIYDEAYDTDPKNNETSGQFDEYAHLDSLFGYGVWDNRRWGGGPITDYLPKGVTKKDFQYALHAMESGISICLSGNCEEYADSDFGETDSCLSIQDWIDRTEG